MPRAKAGEAPGRCHVTRRAALAWYQARHGTEDRFANCLRHPRKALSKGKRNKKMKYLSESAGATVRLKHLTRDALQPSM